MSSVSSVSSSNSVTQIVPNATGVYDPYQILNAHFEAIGGLNEATNEANSYYSGELQVNDNTYTIRQWWMNPSRSKQEIWLDEERLYVSGDNGKHLWEKSGEDPVTEFDDENTPERKVREAFTDFEYLDQKSSLFEVSCEGVTYIEGKKHYEISITNRMTDEAYTRYYNADTLMLSRERHTINDQTIVTDYDNYQDVSGIKKAFNLSVENIDTGIKQTIKISTYKRNATMDKLIFEPISDTLSAEEQAQQLYDSV